MPHEIHGVFAAVATPLHKDGTVDVTTLIRHCRALLAQGCHGLGLLGTTGEANSFSGTERMAILDAVIEGGIDPGTILLGSGAVAVSDAIALTRHGLEAGVTHFLILPPFYYKNVPEAGIIDYYRLVIETAADPKLRVVLYHIPQFSGVPITSQILDRLTARFPGTIAGVKDSTGDIASARHFVRHHPELGLMVGGDNLMLPMLAEGGAGCITGLCNIASTDLRLIYDDHANPASASRVAAAQSRLEKLRQLSAQLPPIASIKAMIAERLDDPAWCRMRPPLTPLDPADQTRLRDALAEIFAAEAAS